MKTYYDVLDVREDADEIEIKKAFLKQKTQYQLSEDLDYDFDLIIDAYETLIDPDLRYLYDKDLTKKSASKKKAKIIISLGLVAGVLIAGYSMKKQQQIEGYIQQLPEGFKTGNIVDKDELINSKDLKEDFILIEVPDYTESTNEKSKFNRNVVKCISQEKDFGFYINTSATTEEEMDAIIYRLNAITMDKKWISNYPLYVEFNNNDNLTKDEFFSNISTFNKKLEELRWFGIFVVNREIYQSYNRNDDIKFHINTDNKEVIKEDDVVSYSYNTSLLGSVFGDSTITGKFNTKIYTKDFRNLIAYNGFNQNDLEEYYIGIDVSEFQGEINWSKTKEQIDFAILRVCDFKNYHTDEDLTFNDILDLNFEKNLEACQKYNIPYDFYYYPRATSIEKIEFECEELNKYLESRGVNPENIRFFIDIESYNNEFVREQLSNKNKNIVNIVNTFCNKMNSYGYKPGIYISQSDLTIFNQISGGLELTSHIPVWCARYGENKNFYSNDNLNQYKEIYNYEIPSLEVDSGVNLWGHQITDNGYFAGIEENTVDVNKVLQKIYDN